MLFNSYSFILFFLPVTFFVFFWAGARRHMYGAAWLTAASLFFYGWWNPSYVGLLLASIAFNYGVGLLLVRDQPPAWLPSRKALLTAGVAGDLALLGYFKYANFFLNSINAVAGTSMSLGEIVLPLGISFFTFTQIAFLVDTYQGKVKEQNFVHYTLFVTYFPHLIAGPVLHHKEMMPQFANPDIYRRNYDLIGVGLTFFVIGLFKKAVLADGMAPYANAGFSAAAAGQALTLLEAWGGVLAYTFQLYFDFSGYSDMAIGASRMFGVRLPLNFDSPYKATNIVDFWRRWHMTLSRFLRDYLYYPLGGNRKGKARRYVNLMITMLLGGLWHGAGWTFVIWGGLHGIYLVINHAWQALRERAGYAAGSETMAGAIAGRALTFVAVVAGWVFFRSADVNAALAMLSGMAGLNGVALPAGFAAYLGPLPALLGRIGIEFTLGAGMNFILNYLWIAALFVIVFFLPNSQQFMSRHDPSLLSADPTNPRSPLPFPLPQYRLHWLPARSWALAMGAMGALGLLTLNRVTEFLYFQF
jgi:alginate O-acetyltransferase complex protein AlgI